MRPGRCEFFAERPFDDTQGSEAQGARGYYRFLGASSDAVKSFSLCGTESVSSLDGDSRGEQPKKVFFVGFPSHLDEEFGLEEMETLKSDICRRLGLEAVFFDQAEECVPRVLQDRAREILTRRLICTAQSCDAACLDLSTRSSSDTTHLAWILGIFSGCEKPVVGYGEVVDGDDFSRSLASASLLGAETYSGLLLGRDERKSLYTAALEKSLLLIQKELYFSL
jgi:nucleoside 2-deoxyribosyltransferase